jgi:hypothetical protein
MGKVTHRGWYSSSDQIPQPISILMGNNLRKDSDEELKKPKEPPKQDKQS